MAKNEKLLNDICISFFVIICLSLTISGIILISFIHQWNTPNNFCSQAYIGIENDEDFINNGFVGEGTAENPYRFENKHINVDGFGLSICGTEAYFSIINCTFQGSYFLVTTEYIKPGTAIFENNTFIIDYYGGTALELIASSDVIIRNNIFKNIQNMSSSYGLSISRSDSCKITGNSFYNCEMGADIGSSKYIEISNNNFEGNEIGLGFAYLENSIIFNNYFFNNSYIAISPSNSELIQILNNIFENNTYGILFDYNNYNFIIQYNQFQTNLIYGIKIVHSFGTLISLNNFIDNHLNGTSIGYSQAYDNWRDYMHGDDNYWYNNQSYIGNYWSDLVWNEGVIYEIDGGNKIDFYPQENPIEI